MAASSSIGFVRIQGGRGVRHILYRKMDFVLWPPLVTTRSESIKLNYLLTFANVQKLGETHNMRSAPAASPDILDNLFTLQLS